MHPLHSIYQKTQTYNGYTVPVLLKNEKEDLWAFLDTAEKAFHCCKKAAMAEI